VATLAPPQPPPAHLADYPPERHYAREAVGVSVGAHIFVVILIGIIALIFHVKSLRDLMLQGGSIEQHAPPPEEKIEVYLKDETPPPPPVLTPEFIRQIVKPPPKPVIVVKPKPKPQPAAPAMVAPKVQMESRLVVGTSGLPHPGYPTRARMMHISGTVMISVSFDSGGKAVNAEIVSSSGSGMLDEPTRSFILENWRNEAFAGKTETVPVEYNLGQ
jgi:TonB family protein